MTGGSPRRLVALLALVLVGSVLVVGSLWLVSTDDAAGNPTLDDGRLADLETVTATRETTVEHGDRTNRTVESVTVRPQTGAVHARAQTTPRLTDVRVSNGSTLWLYDRDANTVLRIDEYGGGDRAVDRIPRLVAAVTDDTATGTTPTVSPLPAVPASNTGRTGPVGDIGQYNISYEGMDVIDGRTTHRLEIGGGSGGEPVANYSQTLWLDTEWQYPLKQRTAWTQGGQRTVITTTYRNVTFNAAVPDDRFVFDPPANATVEVPSEQDQQRYGTRSALQRAANTTVPDPAVPESFTLESATRTTGRIDSVGLQYVNATGTLSVAKLDTVVPATTDGQAVTVAGQNGTYRDLGPTQSIVWSCDGAQYKVRGSGLSRETLLTVADSVGCA